MLNEAVTYNLTINNTKLEDKYKALITNIDLVDASNGADTITIKAEDPYSAIVNDNLFVEDNSVFLEFIYGLEVVKFEGYISAIDIDFPDTGVPSVTIICLDNTHLMNRKKNTVNWGKTPTSEIAKKIALKYGFSCIVDTSPTPTEDVSQSKQTDIEFLVNRANDEKTADTFLCYIEGRTLYYVKKRILSSPSEEFSYREKDLSVISFSAKINKETKTKEVTNQDVNIDSKSTTTDTATVKDSNGNPIVLDPQMVYENGVWVEVK